ncbi:HNH endonuclease [Methylobacterium sp. E-005]|uniref:HNH endonuclease n=1 Tax=Methylobacterium sp. E-005 TaxID=2836549 RepID=UPI001FBBB35F|nr:HNH endonuclease signature motif containing protein [Methylobacterium sp. E-005]MCJ2084440.1 HNH endonuclease [Methylobacterium sp. E-005]
MARREFSKAVQRDAFVRANGKCEGCGAKLSVGRFAYDHRIPDGLTGEPTLENCQVLCTPCHRAKTDIDVADIARAKRRSDKHLGIKDPHCRKLQGAGFAKAPPQRNASRPLTKICNPPFNR